ncbi:MAG TPA: PEP-CTERM sorting domain-containing protein [Tepidisphaeraceae bacterium]|nr:PEP-CTERM sorting domain-containing protein [Tepidisphaeraceae bacterium]
MRSHLVLKSALVGGALAFLAASAQAQIGPELLLNGTLDSPGIHESDTVDNWSLVETPGGSVNSATMASFANHTPDDGDPNTTQVGLWNRSFEGLFFGNNMEPVGARLSQVVGGAVPGQLYRARGWSRWETNYSGGQTTLSAGPLVGQPSPTNTFFAMTFLDAGNSPISSVVLDLRTEQSNGAGWLLHTIGGVAPAGTVSIEVAGITENMVPVTGAQSAFFDDFSLRAVPEPTTLGLASVAAMGMLVRRRK